PPRLKPLNGETRIRAAPPAGFPAKPVRFFSFDAPRRRPEDGASQPPEPAMALVSEFREFAVKGNVVDLAVGAIIGAAFGKIVDSLVKDLIMPLIGRAVGQLDFSNWFILLAPPPNGYTGPMTYDALTKAGVPLLAYGN